MHEQVFVSLRNAPLAQMIAFKNVNYKRKAKTQKIPNALKSFDN